MHGTKRLKSGCLSKENPRLESRGTEHSNEGTPAVENMGSQIHQLLANDVSVFDLLIINFVETFDSLSFKKFVEYFSVSKWLQSYSQIKLSMIKDAEEGALNFLRLYCEMHSLQQQSRQSRPDFSDDFWSGSGSVGNNTILSFHESYKKLIRSIDSLQTSEGPKEENSNFSTSKGQTIKDRAIQNHLCSKQSLEPVAAQKNKITRQRSINYKSISMDNEEQVIAEHKQAVERYKKSMIKCDIWKGRLYSSIQDHLLPKFD